ncbi:MAG: hypothetical protein Fur0025_01760 [Oscillatoriaceae cyanobacterium]
MYAQQWIENRGVSLDSPQLLDPTLLRAARQVYRYYKDVHQDRMPRPLGVVMDRFSYRGHLVFRKRPALLMTECFVTFEQIESGLY